MAKEYKHCENCKYGRRQTFLGFTDVYCRLKHTVTEVPRIKGLFCRYFKGKDV